MVIGRLSLRGGVRTAGGLPHHTRHLGFGVGSVGIVAGLPLALGLACLEVAELLFVNVGRLIFALPLLQLVLLQRALQNPRIIPPPACSRPPGAGRPP